MPKEKLNFDQVSSQEEAYMQDLKELSLKVFKKAENLLGGSQIGLTSHARFKVIRTDLIRQMGDSKESWSAFLNSLVANWEADGNENFVTLSIMKDEENQNKIHIALLDLNVNKTRFTINNQDQEVEFTAEPEKRWGSVNVGGVLADFQLIPSSHQLKVVDSFLNVFAELSNQPVEN